MPYTFSEKQIERARKLLDQSTGINDFANKMNCSIRDAWKLKALVKQNNALANFFEPEKQAPKRPKAEYSNKRLYDLV